MVAPTPVGSTISSMGLPITMTPSTMLSIPTPVVPQFSLANPIIYPCATYNNWELKSNTPLWMQPTPLSRTGEELVISISKIFGANYLTFITRSTSGLPTIVPFTLVKVTLTITPTPLNSVAKGGLKIGFKDALAPYTSPSTYQNTFIWHLTKDEIASGGIFTLTGVIPANGGNEMYLVSDSTNAVAESWGANIRVKVQTGGCIAGQTPNTPLPIGGGSMLTTGSVDDLLVKPPTTTPTPTPTPPISMTTPSKPSTPTPTPTRI
jgi:hypothetical protein